MKIATERAEDWELLQAAHELFSRPPPSAGEQPPGGRGSLEARRLENYRDFLRIDVKMILLDVHFESELSSAAFKQCSDALTSLLAAFENLLDDGIMALGNRGSSSSSVAICQCQSYAWTACGSINTDLAKQSIGTGPEKQIWNFKGLFGWPFYHRTDVDPQSIPETCIRSPSPLAAPVLPVSPFPKLQVVKEKIYSGLTHGGGLNDLGAMVRRLGDSDYVGILQEISSFSRTMRQVYGPVVEPQTTAATRLPDNAEGEIESDERFNPLIRELLWTLHSSLRNFSAECHHEARAIPSSSSGCRSRNGGRYVPVNMPGNGAVAGS